jgi:hypothetical protein
VYNVAYFASRLVLFPTKQLFFIQRKASLRMQKDVKTAIVTMGNLASALDRLNKRNVAYYRQRLQKLRLKLSRSVNTLEYQQGTWYQEIPEQTLVKVKEFESALKSDGEKVIARSDKLSSYVNRLRRKLQGAFDRNIK